MMMVEGTYIMEIGGEHDKMPSEKWSQGLREAGLLAYCPLVLLTAQNKAFKRRS